MDCPINRRLTVMIKEIEGDEAQHQGRQSLRSCVLCAKECASQRKGLIAKQKDPLRKEENLPKRSFLKGYASR